MQLEMTGNVPLCGAEDDCPALPETWGHARGGGAAQSPYGSGGPRDTGQQLHLPALAAASTKVPSPRLWKRKLGPFSLSQKISEALLLRMGPTLTPRPPGEDSDHSEWQKQSPVLCGGLAACEAPKKLHCDASGEPPLSPGQGLKSPKPTWRVTAQMLRQVRSKTKSPCAKGMGPRTERWLTYHNPFTQLSPCLTSTHTPSHTDVGEFLL